MCGQQIDKPSVQGIVLPAGAAEKGRLLAGIDELRRLDKNLSLIHDIKPCGERIRPLDINAKSDAKLRTRLLEKIQDIFEQGIAGL
jgi:hypothetical protein